METALPTPRAVILGPVGAIPLALLRDRRVPAPLDRDGVALMVNGLRLTLGIVRLRTSGLVLRMTAWTVRPSTRLIS